MRATKVPPRDTVLAATPDAVAGAQLFDSIGCDVCHVADIVTAPPGTVINGGAFIVPAALGDKIIHPFSDFLLHDVGTGDGIVQNGGQGTRNKVRTPPLWGAADARPADARRREPDPQRGDPAPRGPGDHRSSTSTARSRPARRTSSWPSSTRSDVRPERRPARDPSPNPCRPRDGSSSPPVEARAASRSPGPRNPIRLAPLCRGEGTTPVPPRASATEREMATEVVMPQMGESIAEGTITKWLVKVGDKVERDQPLFEISTDKVDAEIPCPAAGTLVEIRNQEGETVPVNQVVARDRRGGRAAGRGARAGPPAAPAARPSRRARRPTAAAPKAAVGRPRRRPAAPRRERPPQPRAAAAGRAGRRRAGSLEERVRTLSSPLVRKIAAEEGVDISAGRGHRHPRPGDQARHPRLPRAAQGRAGRGSGRRPAPAAPPLRAGRRAAGSGARPADRLPRPGLHRERERRDRADVEDPPDHRRAHALLEGHLGARDDGLPRRLLQGRQRARDARQGRRSSRRPTAPSSPTCRSSSRRWPTALKAHPKLNAAIDGTNVVFKKDINLGMAVALDWGLIVPVIKNADQLDLVGLAKTANDLADRARAEEAQARGDAGRHLHHHQPGRLRLASSARRSSTSRRWRSSGVGTIEKRPIVVEDEDGNDTIAIRTMSLPRHHLRPPPGRRRRRRPLHERGQEDARVRRLAGARAVSVRSVVAGAVRAGASASRRQGASPES